MTFELPLHTAFVAHEIRGDMLNQLVYAHMAKLARGPSLVDSSGTTVLASRFRGYGEAQSYERGDGDIVSTRASSASCDT